MLCAERLCELPVDVRVLIAHADTEVYMMMYLYDSEFRKYTSVDDMFKKQITVDYYDVYNVYTINDIQYRIYSDGSKYWYKNHHLHKLNGPATSYPDGYVAYWKNGIFHRLDGPARIFSDGREEYYVNGKLHRVDGPARIYPDGREEYWCNDKLHRGWTSQKIS